MNRKSQRLTCPGIFQWKDSPPDTQSCPSCQTHHRLTVAGHELLPQEIRRIASHLSRTPIGIGGRVASPPLPHHLTCGSASGGSGGLGYFATNSLGSPSESKYMFKLPQERYCDPSLSAKSLREQKRIWVMLIQVFAVALSSRPVSALRRLEACRPNTASEWS